MTALLALAALIAVSACSQAPSGSEPDSAGESPAAPDPAAALESVFGAPSQSGFGSAVFRDPLPPGTGLPDAALERYRYFVGDLWQRWGDEAWLGTWAEVYRRPAGAMPDIVAELRGITEPDAAGSAAMILDSTSEPEAGRTALAAVYDDATMTDVRVFRIGDGAAMSGILVAGAQSDAQAVFLVFLLD